MGATIALFAVPNGASKIRRNGTILGFLILANVPDLKFPGWGHERYDISHSIFSIGLLAAILVSLPLFSGKIRNWIGGMKVAVLGTLAMLSHLLLDSTYNHGKGIGLFWPFSEAKLNLALPWFETLQTNLPGITLHSLRVMAIELLFFGAVFLLAWLIHLAWRKRELLSGNSTPA